MRIYMCVQQSFNVLNLTFLLSRILNINLSKSNLQTLFLPIFIADQGLVKISAYNKFDRL